MEKVLEKVKYSFVLPAYKANYLRESIDSILGQTYTDFELILINDGSTDNSASVCDEYAKKDSRVRVFHKENSGVCATRNIGLDHAKGEIICFVDSDDVVEVSKMIWEISIVQQLLQRL